MEVGLEQGQHPQRILVVLTASHRQPATAPEPRPQHLQQEMSRGQVVMNSQWQPGERPEPLADPVEEAGRARRLMTTPLGSPVGPEVASCGSQASSTWGRAGLLLAHPGVRRGSRSPGCHPSSSQITADRRALAGDPLQPLQGKSGSSGTKQRPRRRQASRLAARSGLRADEADPLPTASLQTGGNLADPGIERAVAEPLLI